jgi:hypothetical protein
MMKTVTTPIVSTEIIVDANNFGRWSLTNANKAILPFYSPGNGMLMRERDDTFSVHSPIG